MKVGGPLLRVEDLTTHLFTDAGIVRAVDDVSFHINAGEAVALVGESGCGKSMTALSLMRLIRPPGRILGGRVRFNEAEILELGEADMRQVRGGEMAMVFQDPMTFLNPLMRVGDQIAEAVRIHQRVKKKEARPIVLEALKRVRIPAPDAVIDYFPHQLSGGMRQRVLIAMTITSQPSLLIADEPTTALDVTIQAQVMELLSAIRRELNSAMLLITHDFGLVAEYCDRVYVMYAGRIIEEGDVDSLFKDPQHPYTRCLLKSSLSINRRVETFDAIGGQPPSLIAPPSGCRFHPRCPQAFARCGQEEPGPFRLGDGRMARCWLHDGGTA